MFLNLTNWVIKRWTQWDELVGIYSNFRTWPVPTATNQIGYPVSASGSLTVGLDVLLMKEISAQIMYSYGGFIPDAIIANTTASGTVSANTQSFVIQLIYKIWTIEFYFI